MSDNIECPYCDSESCDFIDTARCGTMIIMSKRLSGLKGKFSNRSKEGRKRKQLERHLVNIYCPDSDRRINTFQLIKQIEALEACNTRPNPNEVSENE